MAAQTGDIRIGFSTDGQVIIEIYRKADELATQLGLTPDQARSLASKLVKCAVEVEAQSFTAKVNCGVPVVVNRSKIEN